MKITEKDLIASLKQGDIRGVYFFYGPEAFLTSAYTEKVVNKLLGEYRDDMNYIPLSYDTPLDIILDSIESMSLFSENKAVVLKDYSPDRLSEEELDLFIKGLAEIPSDTVVIFSITSSKVDYSGKAKANSKALLKALTGDKNSIVCKFDTMFASDIGRLIEKKAKKRGCYISSEDAKYIAECTLCNMSVSSAETDKLCDYVGKGNITRGIIDRLIIKQTDIKAYELANAINRRNNKAAFLILDELFSQRADPLAVIASLNYAYLDLYYAFLALSRNISSSQVAKDFNYAANRKFVIENSMKSVRGLSRDFISKCIKTLSDADITLKTTPANKIIMVEKTVAQLLEYNKAK